MKGVYFRHDHMASHFAFQKHKVNTLLGTSLDYGMLTILFSLYDNNVIINNNNNHSNNV